MDRIEIKYDKKINCFIISRTGLTQIIIKATNGAKALYHLIHNEGHSFKPTLLRNIIKSNVEISPEIQHNLNIKNREEQILYQTLNLFIPATDMKAIISIKKRKHTLEAELLEARENHDLKRIEDLVTEKEGIESYLFDSLSRNGTIRNLNQNSRNAKKSITHAVDLTLNEIAEKSEDIYKILKERLIFSTNQVKYSINSKE